MPARYLPRPKTPDFVEKVRETRSCSGVESIEVGFSDLFDRSSFPFLFSSRSHQLCFAPVRRHIEQATALAARGILPAASGFVPWPPSRTARRRSRAVASAPGATPLGVSVRKTEPRSCFVRVSSDHKPGSGLGLVPPAGPAHASGQRSCEKVPGCSASSADSRDTATPLSDKCNLAARGSLSENAAPSPADNGRHSRPDHTGTGRA